MVKGKVFCITGGGSGIGRATAVRLAELGAKGVAISDANGSGLQSTADQCKIYGTAVSTRRLDVTEAQEVEAWVKDTVDTFGRLDGAANCAGVAGGDGDTTVQTQPQQLWDLTLAVNVTGVMNCMRAQLQYITKPGGSLVNVASTSALFGQPGSAAYAASKFAVLGLTESAAGEFGRQGVRINSILPGPVETGMFKDGERKGLWNRKMLGDETILGRTGEPMEVAKVLAFLLSDDASFVTGGRWTVDGGYAAGRTKTGGNAPGSLQN